MELKKHPVTGMEYWTTLRALAGHAHEDTRKKIESREPIVVDRPTEIGQMIVKLIIELDEKFGVYSRDSLKGTPYDLEHPPEGKENYFDWYERMKNQSSEGKFAEIVCSTCPLNLPPEELRRAIFPCGTGKEGCKIDLEIQ